MVLLPVFLFFNELLSEIERFLNGDIAYITLYPKGFRHIECDYNDVCIVLKLNFIHEKIKQFKRRVSLDIKPKAASDEVDGKWDGAWRICYGLDENLFISR